MKRLLLLTLSLFAFFTTKAQEQDNGYTIDQWDYEALVHENNVWDITETMTVTFLEERHGIYRYIPRLFRRQHGTNGGDAPYTYYNTIEDVEVDGYEFTCNDTDDSQENLVIRIGSEDLTISGQHTYVIRYRMQYQDDRYKVSDELSSVVLGPDCNTSIGAFSFRLRFEKNLPTSLNLHTFSGEWGTEDNVLNVQPTLTSNEISGSAENIKPFTGISIRAELPEGFWVDTKKASSTAYYIAFGIFCALFLLAMSYLIFHRRKRPTVVIEYNAPEGISSAEVGVIIDNTADLSDLTSLIVWFASKGYLKIREVKDNDIELIKIKSLPQDAPKYQQTFWKVFFKDTTNVKLSDLGDKHKLISKAQVELSRTFKGERKLTKVHYPSLLASLGAMVAGACAISLSSSVVDYSFGLAFFAWILWLLPIIVTFCIRNSLSNYDMIKGKLWYLWQFMIFIVLVGINYIILTCFVYEENDNLASLSQITFITLGGWALVLLSGRVDRDTEYRKQQMSLLLGFKEFIKKSELPMLQALVDENPSYFYDVLPYAMVFGLSKKWRKQFEQIKMETPDWYENRNAMNNVSSLMVADRLSNHVAKSINKSIEVSSHDLSSSSSSSSSSFGGGFSGGGGGGVGSW